MIKCTINKKQIEVKEGTTIIEAFYKLQEEGEIAHYCYHPGLSIAGVCRLCMVEIEGNPKLQIACNTLVQDGMVISNKSPQVEEYVRWGLEFHMINHPLDCPICDQAGECILQDQYMKFGKYNPLMDANKVKKRKVVDLGSKVVLDTERCILCARCTRFTDEVTKTKELGIFNRGDRSQIGTFKDKPLENNYSLNTVDICPVGALTSKKFRFKQRVWYLDTKPSVCTGCSTGCNTTLYYNEEGAWRILPRHNKDINGHWMCDKGRETISHIGKEGRLRKAHKWTATEHVSMKTSEAFSKLKNSMLVKTKKIGLVLTGQYTLEEYRDFIFYCSENLNSLTLFHWKNNPETFDSFDNFLMRGDLNPNTNGLLQVAEELDVKLNSFSQLEKELQDQKIDTLIVCGPEDHAVYPDLEKKIQLFLKSKELIWISPRSHSLLEKPSSTVWTIPSKTYFEKGGTLVNYQKKEQKMEAIGSIIPDAFSLSQISDMLSKSVEGTRSQTSNIDENFKENFFLRKKGNL